MHCPKCLHENTKVLDSRDIDSGTSIRRRRECIKCSYRFTTFERIDLVHLQVVKKDGTRQSYERSKLRKGLEIALQKRACDQTKIDQIVGRIEADLQGESTSEVLSKKIGQLVMRRLKSVDKVAYIRYASVYKEFEDLDSLEKELHKLLRGKKR